MAMSRVQQQITWSAANSLTLNTATQTDSDAYTFDSTDVGCSIQVSVDNQGTPQAGDVLTVYIKYSNGDISAGGGADTFDTNEYAQFLMQLDTVAANTPGEDPAIKTVDIPVSAKAFKLSISSPNAATRNMLVKARALLVRAA